MSIKDFNTGQFNWKFYASNIQSNPNQNLQFDISGNSSIIFRKNGTQYASMDTSFNFTNPPTCSGTPTLSNQLVTKNYVDNATNPDLFSNVVTFGNATDTSANKVYYLDSSSNWKLASNTNSVGKLIAIAKGTNSNTNGMYVASNTGNLVFDVSGNVGDILYLSSTAGNLTNVQPSGTDLTYVRPCGYKISSTEIKFYLFSNYIMPAGLAQYGIVTGAGTTDFTSTTITDPSSSLQYQLLTWKSTTGTNTMNVTTAGLFEFFVLGGGGGGGNNSGSGSGGGGGAGQLLLQTAYFPVGTYTIIVGAGGSRGGNNTTSGGRGGFSGIFPTTPAYPKIAAIGGGGGMSTATSGAGGNWNSLNRSLLFNDGFCQGGGAMPYVDSAGAVQYGDYNPSGDTRYLIGSDNTATTGGFYGGTGGNDSNVSATGGGGGLSSAGQAYQQPGAASTRRGGAGGDGVSSGFSGVTRLYGGGGSGGHSTNQTTTYNTNGSICTFTISGTTLTISSVSGSATLGPGYRILAVLPESNIQSYAQTPNNAINPILPGPANNPITTEIFIVSQLTGTTGGVGTYQLNQGFSATTYNEATGNTVTATTLCINPYGNGMGSRNTDTTNNYYWSGSPAGANSGSGAGGGANQNNTGGRSGIGGSGIVMVRYRI